MATRSLLAACTCAGGPAAQRPLQRLGAKLDSHGHAVLASPVYSLESRTWLLCVAALRSAGAATEVEAARPLSWAAGAGGLAAEAAGLRGLRARSALTLTCFIEKRCNMRESMARAPRDTFSLCRENDESCVLLLATT